MSACKTISGTQLTDKCIQDKWRAITMKNILTELTALTWTLAGTGLVLITLSGDTRKNGIFISVAAIVLSLVVAFFKKDESAE